MGDRDALKAASDPETDVGSLQKVIEAVATNDNLSRNDPALVAARALLHAIVTLEATIEGTSSGSILS